jgi:hypothetical protein
MFAAKAAGHCALQSVVFVVVVVVVRSQSNWSLCISKCCCCWQPKQLVTMHYRVLLLSLSAAKATGHYAFQNAAVVDSKSNWSLCITDCFFLCLQPKQLITVHYRVLLFSLSAAKATGHYAFQNAAVVGSKSNWSLCITECCCCLCLQPKQLVTVHYRVLLLSLSTA